MFDHVTIGASSRDASRAFYRTVLPVLGHESARTPDLPEWADFSVAQAGDDRPVTRGLHIGFVAPSHAHVDAFWRAGVEAGHPDDGAPGPRPEYGDDYYGAFLLDPDGNSAEAVFHDDLRTGGAIDHLWWRVRDRRATRRFYAAIAATVDIVEADHPPDRTRFDGGPRRGDFSILDSDTPTTQFQLAFEARDPAGAFGAVLDPDGNAVEAVHHTR